MRKYVNVTVLLFLLLVIEARAAHATNGMNLEGYGAKSHALGGTGMAYDTGNSAVMNNPATLSWIKEGGSRLGLGVRGLHPHVGAWYNDVESCSEGDSYYMPSMSYMRRDGKLSYGVGLLAQGGMGTEYGDHAPLFQYGMSMFGDMVPMSGEDIRSEVSMGRVMLPVSYAWTERTSIGVSVDIVWANMDLRMDMDGSHFASMLGGQGGSVSGSMLSPFMSMMDGSTITDINYVRYDFSNNSAFTGEADGYGFGLKAGFVHQLSDIVSIGAVYHSQTHISDLETSSATLSFNGSGSAFPGSSPVYVNGKVIVKDFEWPETIGAGIALYPGRRWMLVADVKLLNWSAVMDDFKVSFTADMSAENGPFAGESLDVSMDQDWDDQIVIGFGAQYAVTDNFKIRAGVSLADNPVPNKTLNPLFPATTVTHYTCGFGWTLFDHHNVGYAFAYVPEVQDTNADGVTMTHGQTNWSLNYGYNF